MKYILAIDQGTTGSRAVIYDNAGRCVVSAYEEFRQYFPAPGWVEHDPLEIWQSVRNSVNKVVRQVPRSSILAVGITNQRETAVVWDRETGKPVHRAIVWQCRRTADRCRALKNRPGESAFFRERTGLPIDAYFSATKIEWILKNVKGAAQKARCGRLCFGTTDSWVLWKLTGGRSHATDYTNASRTMLFNIVSRAWDRGILKKFGIPVDMLPEVRQSSGIFGYTDESTTALPAGTPVAGIAGDQQAALFGQGCFSAGTIKNTYGTGAFMLLNTGARRIMSKYGLITTLACGRDGGPVYALEGSIFIAGAAVQWLRDGLKVIRRAPDSENIARSVADTGGVYFVPALVGMGAPYWDPDCRGTITGITRGTAAAHIVRAGLEAVCFQTKDVLEAMRRDSGLLIRQLKVDGGAAKNDFLLQFQADITGLRVIRPVIIESTSLGAAYLAGLAVKFWKDTKEIAACWRRDKVFTPRMQRTKARSLYQGWLSAVGRTLSKSRKVLL
ncbi:MAG: glycerol kinase GlpK [Candidatus Omnitrophica bacterium]|nr:glycerol kinase GlpK [Candidatus Omnitrophota bacterium]